MSFFKPKTKAEKRRLYIIGGLVLLIVLFLLYKYVYKKDPLPFGIGEQQNYSSSTGTGTTTATKSTSAPTCTNDTILKRGSRCDRVSWLQYHYNQYVAKPNDLVLLVQDGIFGTKTENAVKFVTSKTSTTWTEFKHLVDSNFRRDFAI